MQAVVQCVETEVWAPSWYELEEDLLCSYHFPWISEVVMWKSVMYMVCHSDHFAHEQLVLGAQMVAE